MLLVQDQYLQNSRKFFESDTSKQVFSEPKQVWEFGSDCEEEILTSGNETEGEDVLYADPSDLPEEVIEWRGRGNSHRKKSVRFEGPDFGYVLDHSETSSLDNEYLGYSEARQRSSAADPDAGHKGRAHFRVPKTKWRTLERKHACERRPKSTPERGSGYLEGGTCGGRRAPGDHKKEHQCGRFHRPDLESDEFACWKAGHRYKFECGDEIPTRHRDRYSPDEGRQKKSYVQMKPTSLPGYKHSCHAEPEAKSYRKVRGDHHYDPLLCHAAEDLYCRMDEYYDHVASKGKKKVLESVQEQQEQQEQFSDSTYKIPCSKYSSHMIPGEFQGKRSVEKLTNSSQSDWLYCRGKGCAGERIHDAPPRMHKMRSRRTRMNRIKNGWKKAFVQTVRDGSRNERVGVIVMGSKGPEFYAKNSKKPPGAVPSRKSKSFLDGGTNSFEVMTIDCKNVFLSSSEPGPRSNYAINDLVCPEDDAKVDEKIAKFSKNVSDIVRSSEEKFYKTLSGTEHSETKKTSEGIFKGAGEGTQELDKNNEKRSAEAPKPKYPFHLPPFDPLSPRVPKSMRKPERKVNEESKAMADALNQQAKQYRESQASREETFLEGLTELQYATEANLSPWDATETKEEEKEPTAEANEREKREEVGKDGVSQTGSAKSNEQININKQRRKKYYESTTNSKGGGKEEEEEENGTPSKARPISATTPRSKRVGKSGPWGASPDISFEGAKGAEANAIPALFRDMVESGRAISLEETENLQNILERGYYNAEACSNGPLSSSSLSEGTDALCENKANVSPRSSKTPSFLEETKKSHVAEESEKGSKECCSKGEDGSRTKRQQDASGRKALRMKNIFDDSKHSRSQKRETKSRKKAILENKMKLLREALPSIAAENEAAHLKQLKKYIDRFIDRVETSTSFEFRKRKENRPKCKDSASTDSGEVKVDARKILDFVSNPFKKISSDVTINIAKKLTDALVQEKSSRAPKNLSTSTKARKTSEMGTDEGGFACGASSGSERYEEPEPTYLKQLKKMRNEHLNNIVLEVRRLSELLRFLDRCNRLHV